MKKHFRIFILISILITAALCGCADKNGLSADTSKETAELFAMDTVMNLTAYGENAKQAINAASDEIKRLDAVFSISSSGGDIKSINETGSGSVSSDTAALINRAAEISKNTDGLFDCTIAPVMDAWGFTTKNYRIPETTELKTLLASVDYNKISITDNTVTLPENMKIDLGGIAKGFTSNRIMEIFSQNGVSSGIISLGGNVQALGSKPDGSPWRIAIQDPININSTFAVLNVENKAVITSGGYQRYFEKDGKKYHHIINPRTGYPADSGLISVTIVSSDGTLADALSTALFIMGKDQAADYWRKHSSDFEAVLVTENGDVCITQGLENSFEMSDGSAAEIII